MWKRCGSKFWQLRRCNLLISLRIYRQLKLLNCLWAALRNKTYLKSIGYKRSAAVWKQMWKQCLITSTKLRTVNQRFCGQNLGKGGCLFFISHDTFCKTATGLGDAANLQAGWEYWKILIFQINFPGNTLCANQFLLFRISNLRSNLLTDHR